MANITLSPEVTDILNRSTITETALVLPPERLDRKIYEAVNKALVAAGGKWNRSAQAHVFKGDPRVKLGLALETGVVVDEKKLYQAFFTPAALAARVATLAEVEGHLVLDPSAGEGALADACLDAGAAHVDCVELNPEYVVKLKDKGYKVAQGDFLKCGFVNLYPRIVMNPPFTKNQDIRHVTRALELLEPFDGILVAIMPSNTKRVAFQAMLNDYDHYIEDVPAGTFKEAGTPIATIILRVIT